MTLIRRALVAPFLVTLLPLLVLLNVERRATVGDPAMDPGVVAGLTVAAVAVSLGAAALLAPRLPDVSSTPAWARPVVAPSDGTLAVVTVLVALIGAAFVGPPVGGAAGTVSEWLLIVALLPMVLLRASVIVLGNPFVPGVYQPAAEAVAGAVGTALSVVWLFVLVGWALERLGIDPTCAD